VPQGPDFHQVGSSAAQDEDAKHEEDPVEGQVPPLANQIHQHDGDHVIGEGHDAVGDGVQPDDFRLPRGSSSRAP